MPKRYFSAFHGISEKPHSRNPRTPLTGAFAFRVWGLGFRVSGKHLPPRLRGAVPETRNPKLETWNIFRNSNYPEKFLFDMIKKPRKENPC